MSSAFCQRAKRAHTFPTVETTPVYRPVYPTQILRAVEAATDLPGLPRGVRSTLATLCRYLDPTSPDNTLFAHKDTLAEQQGVSERTLYRHLNKLAQHGLIALLPQERKSRNGRFSVARIQLTSKAIACLY